MDCLSEQILLRDAVTALETLSFPAEDTRQPSLSPNTSKDEDFLPCPPLSRTCRYVYACFLTPDYDMDIRSANLIYYFVHVCIFWCYFVHMCLCVIKRSTN